MGKWDEKPKNRFDEAGSKLSKPIGLPTNDQLEAIKFARNQERDIGKFARDAKRNNDIRAFLAAVGAGYTNRGNENVDDKTERYVEKANQKRFQGDSVVGSGQQPAEQAQQPFGGGAMGNGRGTTPWNAKSSSEGSSGGQWVNTGGASSGGTQPLPPNTPPVPAPTAGFPVGSGSEIGTAQPATPAMSAAEQSKQATLEKTLAGNFGKVAQARAQAKQSGETYDATPSFDTRTEGRKAFVDTVKTLYEETGGINERESEQARARGAALGLTPQQIQDTLDEQTELSPEAIAERAKDRKQKKFGDSDKKIEEAIAGLDKTKFTPEQIAQIKENMKGLSSQDRKDSTDFAKKKTQERGYNPNEISDILSKYKTTGDELIRSGKDYDKAMLDRVAETRKTLSDMTKAGENREQAYSDASDQAAIDREKGLLKNKDAYSVQQRLQSDYYDEVIASEEFKQREQNKSEVSQTYNYLYGDNAPEVGAPPEKMNYENFNPDYNPKAYSKEKQSQINEDQDRRIAELRGVKYEPRPNLDSMSREEFLKYAGTTAREAEEVLKKNAENKIRTVSKTYAEWAGEALKKKLAEARGEKLTPQAQINTKKIQGAYEKASRGADDILFGLSFDQRKV